MIETLSELSRRINPDGDFSAVTPWSEIEVFRRIAPCLALYARSLLSFDHQSYAGKSGDKLKRGMLTARLRQLIEWLRELKQLHDEITVRGMSENEQLLWLRDNDEKAYGFLALLAAVEIIAERADKEDAVGYHIVKETLTIWEMIIDSSLMLDHTWSPEFGSYCQLMGAR